jgi:anaerobic selenocysteine-containing dehydrogenase
MADVVLPATNWLEQEGHYINLEGKSRKPRKPLPPEECWSLMQTVSALSDKMSIKLTITGAKQSTSCFRRRDFEVRKEGVINGKTKSLVRLAGRMRRLQHVTTGYGRKNRHGRFTC